tara:strand:- start:146 stop:1822 length:1677 start_codon:yes stop_codon:yes gene_type:complete
MAEKKTIKDEDIKEAVEAKEETDVGVADTQLTNLSREELMTELYRRGRTPEDVINQTNLTGPEIEALATLNEGKNKGGSISKQMELFSEGGLKQEGGSVDPVSGNDVPVGSTKKEVRDDIPAQLSEGEFVMPADVVRFHGLDKMMELRDEAKAGLRKMEAMGQMGNADEATLPDDVPFGMDDLDMDDEPKEMAEGGVVQAANGTFMSPNTGIGGFQQSQFANYNPQFTPYMPTQLPTTSYIMPQQQATPLASQQTLPKFEDVIPAPEGKYDEIIEYENEEGSKLSIPFVDGKPIYPIPKGYKKVDTDIVKPDPKTATAPKVKSTRVIETGDGDAEPSLEEQGYRKGATVTFMGGKNVDGKRVGSRDIGVIADVPGGLFGLGGTLGGLIAGITGNYPEGTKFGISLKGDPQTIRYVSAERYKTLINNPEEGDKFLNDMIKSKSIEDDVKSISKDRRIDDKLTKDKDFMQDISSIQKGITDKSFKDTAPKVDTSTDGPEDRYDPGTPSASMGDDDNSSVSQGPSGYGGTGFGSSFATAKGGFISKKPKPKKMKQGGLASR